MSRPCAAFSGNSPQRTLAQRQVCCTCTRSFRQRCCGLSFACARVSCGGFDSVAVSPRFTAPKDHSGALMLFRHTIALKLSERTAQPAEPS